MPFDGEKLRTIRESAGMERNELASVVGTTRQYISHLENGVRGNPGYDLVEKLAKALAVDCRDFASEELAPPADTPPAIEKPKRGRPKKKPK